MKQFILQRKYLVFYIAACIITCPAFAHAGSIVQGQAEVRLEDGVLIEDIHATYGTTTIDILLGLSRPHYHLALPVGLTATDFVIQAEVDPRIKTVDFIHAVDNPMPSTQSLFFPRVAIEYWNQPTRHTIGLNRGDSGGLPVPPPVPPPGAPVVVAIVDTGVDLTHPLLAGSLVPGVSVLPGEASTNDAPNGIDEDNDGIFDEVAGHGTFVAGLVHYVAPKAKIMPIRAMTSDGTSTSFLVAKGILEAVAAGANVINVSLGTLGDTSVISEAVLTAEGLGIIVVASSGNNATNGAQFPANYSLLYNTVGVSGTNDNDILASFSNFGVGVTLCAPSVNLVSSFHSGQYRSASGTSFSTALVTGTVARVLAWAPGTLPIALRATLVSTAAPIDALNPGFTGMLGAGRLDAANAFAAVGTVPPLIAGDLNGDGAVGLSDLNIMLSNFGQPGAIADIDGDGLANIDDLQLMLFMWGAS